MSSRTAPIASLLVASFTLLLASWAVADEKRADHHIGLYYPEPQIREVYASKLPKFPTATAKSRAAFAVGIALQQAKRYHAPTYHLFVKGAQRQKIIIVATESGRYSTHYQLRALLAGLTTEARSTQLLNRAPNPEFLNFLDFCKLMGFKRITVSDGNKIALQIDVK